MIMMDGMVFVRGSTSRSISASAAERTLLLGALATHMGVLDTRENDAQTVLRKSELWDEITRHFNSNTSTPRSRQQIQTLYKNMKAKARRYEARLAEMANGIPPPDPDPISEMLLGLLHQQLRHQQRHLRNLVARDTQGIIPVNLDQSPASHQICSPFINPEQMMQISLSEGTADDIDIKSECGEDDFSTTDPLSQDFSEAADNYSKILETSVSSPTADVSLSSNETSDGHIPLLDPLTSDIKAEENQNQPLPLINETKSSHISAQFQSGMTDKHPDAASKSNIYQPPTHSSDLFAALRCLSSSSDETLLKKIPIDGRPESVSPSPKRQRMECVSKNCLTSGARNLGCFCPEIHTRLLAMAQEEHHLKTTLLRKELGLRDREHVTRMRILALDEEESRLRLEKMKHSMPVNTDNPKIPNKT